MPKVSACCTGVFLLKTCVCHCEEVCFVVQHSAPVSNTSQLRSKVGLGSLYQRPWVGWFCTSPAIYHNDLAF